MSGALIVSDVHLRRPGEDTERALFSLFDEALQRGFRQFLILGDLFDYWYGRPPRAGWRADVVQGLRQLADRADRVLYLEGNHDVGLSPVASLLAPVEHAEGEVEIELAGQRILLAHGDRLGPGLSGFHRLVRGLPFRILARVAGRAIQDPLGNLLASTARLMGDPDDRIWRRSVLDWATERTEAVTGPDLIAVGHGHCPALQAAGNGWLLRNGDFWTRRAFSTLVPEGDRLIVQTWRRDPDGWKRDEAAGGVELRPAAG